MKLSEWLDAENGRTKATAEHFKVTPGAITQWRDGVPRGRMRELHAFTESAVSLGEMVPGVEDEVEPQATEAAASSATPQDAIAEIKKEVTAPIVNPALKAVVTDGVQAGVFKASALPVDPRPKAWNPKTDLDRRDPTSPGRRNLDTKAYAALGACEAGEGV